jgi:hypothetical protein
MIVAFAFGLIGALLVLANYRILRKPAISVIAFILAAGLVYLGIYFMLHSSKETDTRMFFAMFSPLTALILFHITRYFYKKSNEREIILHLKGLFPVKQEERYVTKREINITFILLVSAVLIPFFAVLLINLA